MACPTGSSIQIVSACDFPQFLVDQTPKFDELIMEDMRVTDGWLLNVSTGTLPLGTPTEVTQDRFRSVFPNTTKQWNRVHANGPGCTGAPCDPTEHCIGWGADRLTWFAEMQNWATPLMCYDQDMHITHAKEHVAQIISKILRPATSAISSNFLRKRHVYWAKSKNVANANCGFTGTDGVFTYAWGLGGINGDEEQFFDCSVAPNRCFLLAPQMLQRRFNPLMLKGYAGENPFKDTSPFIELVSDMDTVWNLEHLGGGQGFVAGTNDPNVLGNWRFTNFDESTKYWRYGFSGQIGNFMTRVDPMNLRFNFVADRGANAAPNRYRYQIVLPYKNSITTGAGGSAGIGSDENPDFERAQFGISHIHHKKGMELLVPDATPINPEMPFGHRDFGGKWQFVMDNLGADEAGNVIQNKRRNKGQFIADFKYYVRPLHYEFMEVFFHKREQFCVPEVTTCNADPGYPTQHYDSCLPGCPVPDQFDALYGTGVPTGDEAGPVPQPPTEVTSTDQTDQ